MRKFIVVLFLLILSTQIIYATDEEMQDIMDLYHQKGETFQYYDEGVNCAEILDIYSDEIQPTCCSDFVYDFYYTNYGVVIGHSTKQLTNSEYIYRRIYSDEWLNLINLGVWKEELLSELQVGDLINVVNVDTQKGHVMMVYEIYDDDALLIHSVGSRNGWDSHICDLDSSFIEGSVRKQYLSTVFSKYMMAKDIQLIRPLQVYTIQEEYLEEYLEEDTIDTIESTIELNTTSEQQIQYIPKLTKNLQNRYYTANALVEKLSPISYITQRRIQYIQKLINVCGMFMQRYV